jgi:two-component system nitrogen regulation sensor histidine kinase NtrY
VRVNARLDTSSGTCTVVVSDNGPGFPEQARERIFHPFFTTKSQGTGLGLALVQKIVVTHNGRVAASDGPGGRITITLPVLS